MIPQPNDEFIITEEQWLCIFNILPDLAKTIHSRPYTPTNNRTALQDRDRLVAKVGQEKVIMDLRKLIVRFNKGYKKGFKKRSLIVFDAAVSVYKDVNKNGE